MPYSQFNCLKQLPRDGNLSLNIWWLLISEGFAVITLHCTQQNIISRRISSRTSTCSKESPVASFLTVEDSAKQQHLLQGCNECSLFHCLVWDEHKALEWILRTTENITKVFLPTINTSYQNTASPRPPGLLSTPPTPFMDSAIWQKVPEHPCLHHQTPQQLLPWGGQTTATS